MLQWRADCAFGQPPICRQVDAGWDPAEGSHVLGLEQGAGVQALRVCGGEGSLEHCVQPPRSHSHTEQMWLFQSMSYCSMWTSS